MGRCNGGAQAKARFDRRQARLHVRLVGDPGPARCGVVANAGCDLATAAGARCVCAARGRSSAALWCKPGRRRKIPLLTPNYIEALLGARDLDAIRHETILQPPPPYAALLAVAPFDCCWNTRPVRRGCSSTGGYCRPRLRREPELVDLPLGQLMQTVWRQMATKISVPDVPEPVELGKYLLGFTPSGEPDLGREPDLKALSEFRASLAHLKSLTPTRLEELMTGTLDLCSYRLDAWITSLATKRLAEMRKANPGGVLFGGYGWVMNLQPATGQSHSRPAARRTRPAFSVGEQSRLRSRAVADSSHHGGRAAQRPSGSRRQSNAKRSAGH